MQQRSCCLLATSTVSLASCPPEATLNTQGPIRPSTTTAASWSYERLCRGLKPGAAPAGGGLLVGGHESGWRRAAGGARCGGSRSGSWQATAPAPVSQSVSQFHLSQPPRADKVSASDRQSQHPVSHPNIHRKVWRHEQDHPAKRDVPVQTCPPPQATAGTHMLPTPSLPLHSAITCRLLQSVPRFQDPVP